MKFSFCFILLAILLSIDISLAKVYSRCGFAKELHGHGMTPREIATWTCIAEYTTGFNTSALRGPFDDKTKVHGPFLISDRWWCAGGFKGGKNLCKTTCKALRSSRVTASVNCARKIYQQQGYEAWVVWTKKCDGKLPNLEKCLK
ncbi:inactive lysozyme 1A-like isoform X3 [Chrysoperla carnea]|uniref:inactive lysozyme 1A-like isoform X3 n=1 Tax=Chrysoperla carnea TaxID=189513 RepID=UPI001D05E4AE|nr:inactive lysozyme 1A-like isoform X3 [Chrysoperla carnea]